MIYKYTFWIFLYSESIFMMDIVNVNTGPRLQDNSPRDNSPADSSPNFFFKY